MKGPESSEQGTPAPHESEDSGPAPGERDEGAGRGVDLGIMFPAK